MSKKYTSKNIEVTWAFDLKKKLRENFSNKEWANLTNYVVDQMILKKIDKGLSPVNGERMFQKYKNPKVYPGDQKQNNKPNLTLKGNMLSYYEAKPTNNEMQITIGIHKDAPKEQLIKALANNQGTQGEMSKAATHKLSVLKKIKPSSDASKEDKRAHRLLANEYKSQIKGIPARPFIPLKGQSFTRDIVLEVRKLFAYCLDKAIKKGK